MLLMLMLCFLVGCSREEFALQRIHAYPVIINHYGASEPNRVLEGLSIAFLPVLRETSDYSASITAPSGSFSWEHKLFPFEVDGLDYLGFPDLTLPAGFPLPQGIWEAELLHSDGRRTLGKFTLEDNALLRSVRKEPQLWIPQFSWERDASSPEIWQLFMRTTSSGSEARSLQDMWEIQCIDAKGVVLSRMSAKEGRVTSSSVADANLKANTVLIKCSRYDASIGCVLIGFTRFT